MKLNKNILVILAFVLYSYLGSILNHPIFPILQFLLGVLLLIFNFRIGLWFFLLSFYLTSDYVVYGGSEIERDNITNIYVTSFGPTTIMVLWVLIILLALFVKKFTSCIRYLQKNIIIKLLLVLLIISSIMMFFNLGQGKYVIKTIISDIRFFLNTFTGFLTVYVLVNSKYNLEKVSKYVLIGFVIQAIVIIISSYIQSKVFVMYNFQLGTESYLVAVLVGMILFLLLKSKKHLTKKEKKLIPFFLLIILTYTLSASSRGRLILILVSVLFFLILSKRLKYLLYTIGTGAVSIMIVYFINPSLYEYFVFKLTTFSTSSWNSTSSLVRITEFLNITKEQIYKPHYFFSGKGLGGFFTESYDSFGVSLFGKDAYPEEWLIEKKYYKPHSFALYAMLKYGVFWFVVYYSIVLVYTVKYVNKFYSFNQSAIKNKYYYALSFGILLGLPLFSLIIFSSKLQLVFGALLAILSIVIREERFLHIKSNY